MTVSKSDSTQRPVCGEAFAARTQAPQPIAHCERLGPERMAYTVNAACAALSISRTSLYALVKKGELKRIRIAGRTLVPRSELERLLRIDG